jgi:5'-methylthioadenosine phosphorylase
MIGIIGGTGLYRMADLRIVEERLVETPFGPPSSAVMLGRLGKRDVAFLARHGAGHQLTPSEINFRANIWALKSVGVRTVIGVSAVGSLREELDFTRGRRIGSFFGNGLVAHVSTARPSCPDIAAEIVAAAGKLGYLIHSDKTYACVEGPRLGTRAESFMLRGAGADLVGMTNVPEAFLACEAQMSYCTIAVVTDYDCWQDDPSQHVTLEMAMTLFGRNLQRVQKLLAKVVAAHKVNDRRASRHLLEKAIVTSRERMTPEHRELVELLLR